MSGRIQSESEVAQEPSTTQYSCHGQRIRESGPNAEIASWYKQTNVMHLKQRRRSGNANRLLGKAILNVKADGLADLGMKDTLRSARAYQRVKPQCGRIAHSRKRYSDIQQRTPIRLAIYGKILAGKFQDLHRKGKPCDGCLHDERVGRAGFLGYLDECAVCGSRANNRLLVGSKGDPRVERRG